MTFFMRFYEIDQGLTVLLVFRRELQIRKLLDYFLDDWWVASNKVTRVLNIFDLQTDQIIEFMNQLISVLAEYPWFVVFEKG